MKIMLNLENDFFVLSVLKCYTSKDKHIMYNL